MNRTIDLDRTKIETCANCHREVEIVSGRMIINEENYRLYWICTCGRARQQKITKALVAPVDNNRIEVTAMFEDGTIKSLFSCSNKLCFQSQEFIGLTEVEALALRHDKSSPLIRVGAA